MLDADGKRGVLDLAQTSRGQQLLEMPFAGACERRLVFDVRVEFSRHVPEQGERAVTAGVIPHACRDDAVGAGHPRHLGQARDRVVHEMDDELRQGRVERVVRERQPFGLGLLHVDIAIAIPYSRDERRGRVDRRDR